MIHPWRRVLGALVVLPAVVCAQADDPKQRLFVVRTVLTDGSPMPGVPLVRDVGVPAALAAPDGWLRRLDARLVEAAWDIVGRSDPDGSVAVSAPDGKLRPQAIRAGAPFRSEGLERDGERWVMRVTRLEQFIVKAVDVDGAPLARFPLALQRNGEDESIAWTDERGRAIFGVDPSTTVRLVVVPYGWIGSTDGFPTVARQLPEKIRTFQVPAFGRVRVRTQAGGVAKQVSIRGVSIRGPYSWSWPSRGGADALFHGVEIAPVAVGEAVRGTLRVEGGELEFTAPAIVRHGELVTVDVDVDPTRARFALQLVAPGLRPERTKGGAGQGPLVSVDVRVVLYTDAGPHHATGRVAPDGSLTIDPGRDGVPGARLRRVDVDVTETETRFDDKVPVRTTKCWSGTLATDVALAPTTLDLGTLRAEPHADLLHGRVVDEQGRPMARAMVEIAAAGATRSLGVFTDERGEFALAGPLLRDAGGRPAGVVATASRDDGPDAIRSEPSAPTAAGGEVTLVLRSQLRGYLRIAMHLPLVLPRQMLQFAFVEANGRIRELDGGRVVWSGDSGEICRLGPLPPGRGALRILLRPGVLLRTIADLEVAKGVSDDARLADLDLSSIAKTCRMRVLDEEGVPIANARVEYRTASDQCSSGPSDSGGVLEIVKGPPKALRVVVSAPGKQPVELTDVVDGADVRLRAMPNLCVTVKGLPADVPRADLALFFRSVVRENLADTAQAQLGAGDTAVLPLPPPGLYHLRLTLRQPAGTGSSWTLVGQRADDVLVGRDGDALELVVDAAMLDRLRELRAK